MIEVAKNLGADFMPAVKTRTECHILKIKINRQVTIPKDIFDDLGFAIGDFVEVKRAKGGVFIKLKKLVDPDDILTPEDEASIRRGLAQIKRGEYVTLDELKKELKL